MTVSLATQYSSQLRFTSNDKWFEKRRPDKHGLKALKKNELQNFCEETEKLRGKYQPEELYRLGKIANDYLQPPKKSEELEKFTPEQIYALSFCYILTDIRHKFEKLPDLQFS